MTAQPGAAGGPALTIDRVTKRFGETVALRELSLSVLRGEMFGLIGPDGAGKTTTIRLLCGLIRTDGGQIRVQGLDPARDHQKVIRSVGDPSQRFTLYGDLTVDENIAFFAEIHGVERYQGRRERLLELTRLTPFRARLAEQLSGGMKQKLALACTLVHEPEIILLDEPTTGVDPVSRREFWKLLAEFLSHGITILMATPYLDEAERCSRVALLHEGQVLALDDPGVLRESLPGDVLEVVADEPNRTLTVVGTLPGVADVQLFGERLHVRLHPGVPLGDPARLAAALAERRVTGVNVRRIPPSLEDVFIARLAERAKGIV